jgi:hypothetical protein
MDVLTGILCMMVMAFPVTVLWVAGIDHMKGKHPDYKGEDFLDEE